MLDAKPLANDSWAWDDAPHIVLLRFPFASTCRSKMLVVEVKAKIGSDLLKRLKKSQLKQITDYYPGSKEGHIPTQSASKECGAFPSTGDVGLICSSMRNFLAGVISGRTGARATEPS